MKAFKLLQTDGNDEKLKNLIWWEYFKSCFGETIKNKTINEGIKTLVWRATLDLGWDHWFIEKWCLMVLDIRGKKASNHPTYFTANGL